MNLSIYNKVRTILLVGLPLLLAACSGNGEDSKENPTPLSDASVAFSTDVEAATRTANLQAINDVDALKALPEGFGVIAYYTGAATWAGSSSTTAADAFFMHNQPVAWTFVYHTGTGTTEDPYVDHYNWTYSPLKYWPNSTNNATSRYISFFAYAPYVDNADILSATSGITGITDNSDKLPHVDFTIPATGTVPDLLWAATTNATRNGNGLIAHDGSSYVYQTVPLRFKHALSAVEIYVERTYDETTSTGKHPDNENDAKLYINQLQLALASGIYKSGRLSLEDGSWSETGFTTDNTALKLNGNDLADKIRGAQPDAELSYIRDAELNRWGYKWSEDEQLDNESGIHPTGVTERLERLTSSSRPLLFIPEQSITLTPTLNYSMVTKDNNLILSTLTDDNGNKYSRITNEITGNDITLTLAGGKRYRLIIRIGVEHIAFEIASVEDWDFPMRFQPTVKDWDGNEIIDKTLSE